MSVPVINSRSNERVRRVRRLLDDRAFRHERREYIIEGANALETRGRVIEVFIREDVEYVPPAGIPVWRVSAPVFKAISSTENSQGIVAVAELALQGPSALKPDRRYLLLDRIQDPGNMGTLLRSARAFVLDGVILTPGCVDPFSPKVVRAAAGAVGSIDIISIPDLAPLAGFTVIAADARGKDLRDFAWPPALVLAVGNEAQGVSAEILGLARDRVAIPMEAGAESLNAGVAAGILLYALYLSRHRSH